MAFTEPQQTGAFNIRCAELCGLYHGAMYDSAGWCSDRLRDLGAGDPWCSWPR